MSGIYIHIPFCKQACSYCDFYFVTRDRLIPEFVDALVHEISAVPLFDGSPFPSDPVRTLYLGGGTPSRLPLSQLERIFEALHRQFDLSGLTECTVEVNPEDVTTAWLDGLRDLGVTRLSMGIQSFQPELLDFMHRAHSSTQAHYALDTVTGAGFPSFSVDLIYGCPGQSDAQLRDDLEQLLAYSPPHVSAYSLTIEPRTRLGKQAELGRLAPADDETVAGQARMIRESLASRGVERYEISNYAAPGHEAEHNSAYWNHQNYLGLGPAAHSFFWPVGHNQALRWHHAADIHNWSRTVQSEGYQIWVDAAVAWRNGDLPGVNGPTPPDGIEIEQLPQETLAGERMMTGLRTSTGVDPDQLLSRYGHPLSPAQRKRVEEFRHQGWMEPEAPLRLTDRGFELADAIILRLLE